MNPVARELANVAYTHLCHAGVTGDWIPLLSLTSEDFEFLFPAGPHRGHFFGREGKQKFLEWVAKRQQSRSSKTLESALCGERWAVFCVDSVGQDPQGRFQTHVALFFKVEGQQITGCREYIGDMLAWV